MPINPEDAAPSGFDPVVYWIQNKNKVITYAALLVLGLLAYGAYQFSTQRTLADSQALFAQASKPEDYRQVIEKYPRSIAAGNAELLLAVMLRNDKKYDDAISTLHDFINQYPDHPLAATGSLSLATTLEAEGKTDEALDAYQQVATKFPATYAAPLALMAQASLLMNSGKTEEARRIYENVTAQYQESYLSPQAQQSASHLRKQ